MLTLDPYGGNTLNTAAAFYECWECDGCDTPPDWPPIDGWQ
ncbi:MAG TPA: hypothetical protein VFJ82_25400 [Longimicrobium sp.]|nr:hypothetical protein [Longimicrobium sp.]